MGEDGARVGDDVLDEGGNETGSKSRSGIGGLRSGLRVIRNRTNRRKVLRSCQNEKSYIYQSNTHFRTSRRTMALHLVLLDTFLRNPISITSSVKRTSSRARAAHLYR